MKKCKRCEKEFNDIERKRSKYCSVECAKSYMTPEFRDTLAMKRRKYLAENPDKHPWKSKDKFKSKPCSILKEYLRTKGISFVDEWQPLIDRGFSIDIAFPDIKFGIEVNGNQHYNNDGTLKKYYQDRHDLITNNGWTLIELHYSSCFKDEILDTLITKREQPDYSEYFKIRDEVRREKEKNKPEPRGVKNKRKSEEKWSKIVPLVESSGIEFEKFGWVKQVSNILGIAPQKVNGWMKRYLPDIYKQRCFKRGNNAAKL